MTKKYIPLGILSILATACEPISIEVELDQKAKDYISDILDGEDVEPEVDQEDFNISDTEEQLSSEELDDNEENYSYGEENSIEEENEYIEQEEALEQDQSTNEDESLEIEEAEIEDLEEEFHNDDHQNNHVEESCDDLYKPERKALWIQTDYINNSNPANTALYGSSEAAELLEEYNVTWDALRLNDMDFNPLFLMNYDLIILYGQGTMGPLNHTDAAVLEYWVLQGGGLFYHTYHPTDNTCDMLNSLPSNFGISCESGNDAVSATGFPIIEHPINNDIEQISVLGGEMWDVQEPAQSVIEDSLGRPLVTTTEWGFGRVVGLNDEWPLYNSGTGGSDISSLDNYTLVDNAFCWLLGDCNEAESLPELFECDQSINFLLDVEYNQMSLTDYCHEEGNDIICNANPIYNSSPDIDLAVEFCQEICLDDEMCTGFFFQRHQNGHEICGFYTEEIELIGLSHGHQGGSRVCKKN